MTCFLNKAEASLTWPTLMLSHFYVSWARISLLKALDSSHWVLQWNLDQFWPRGSYSNFNKSDHSQKSGYGSPHRDAMHNFIPDSKSLISGLFNNLSFVSKLFLKGGQNSPNVLIKMDCFVSNKRHCTFIRSAYRE